MRIYIHTTDDPAHALRTYDLVPRWLCLIFGGMRIYHSAPTKLDTLSEDREIVFMTLSGVLHSTSRLAAKVEHNPQN